jgi:hypothetical protein
VAIFGTLSLHPKIPFPAAGCAVRRVATPPQADTNYPDSKKPAVTRAARRARTPSLHDPARVLLRDSASAKYRTLRRARSQLSTWATTFGGTWLNKLYAYQIPHGDDPPFRCRSTPSSMTPRAGAALSLSRACLVRRRESCFEGRPWDRGHSPTHTVVLRPSASRLRQWRPR